jgi:hypothetical protein
MLRIAGRTPHRVRPAFARDDEFMPNKKAGVAAGFLVLLRSAYFI